MDLNGTLLRSVECTIVHPSGTKNPWLHLPEYVVNLIDSYMILNEL